MGTGRLLSITSILAAVVVLTLASIGPTAAGPLAGDANCDGDVDSIDASIILQLDAGLVSSLPCPQNADANGDGGINAIDASLILQFAAGLISNIGPSQQNCTYNGPYFFSGSLPETAQSTSTFCLTERRAIIEWTFAHDYVAVLGVFFYDESANYLDISEGIDINKGNGSRSLQMEGPGYYFMDIELFGPFEVTERFRTTQASWTLTIRQ